MLCWRSTNIRVYVCLRIFLHLKTAEEYVEHIVLFNIRVELSNWSWQCGPPPANLANYVIPIYKIKRICTWRPSLANASAQLHTDDEEEDVLHIFLYGFWC